MLGNFTYHNPTRLHFGPEALDQLAGELAHYGPRVQLIYGGGSIKKSGLYDQVLAILQEAGKTVVEDGGVMPNPTVEKLYEGCRIAKENDVDLLLAVGGGSCCDYAKAVSVSAWCSEDPWEKYYLRMEEPSNRTLPVGCVLTMVGTGSEMNGGSVITNHQEKRKIGHVFGPEVYPKFSILNPVYTLTLPKVQMVAGIYDIMNHITEQYFSDADDCTSDYLMEGLMRSLIHSSRIAVADPQNYEARSNLMWIATWALNTLVDQGKTTDDRPVGRGLHRCHPRHDPLGGFPAILPVYSPLWGPPVPKVCGERVGDRPDKQVGRGSGLGGPGCHGSVDEGLVLSLRELGVTEEMLEGIVQGTFVMDGGYRVLEPGEILEILKASL